jgi:hypothetical protein
MAPCNLLLHRAQGTSKQKHIKQLALELNAEAIGGTQLCMPLSILGASSQQCKQLGCEGDASGQGKGEHRDRKWWRKPMAASFSPRWLRRTIALVQHFHASLAQM